MIYYIVGINKINLNEWIISTHDTAERATHYLENYRATSTDDNVMFRIDTVPSNEEARAANAKIPADPNKLALNKAYGKAKMDHEEQHYAYRDTDSMQTKEFTVEELFTEPAEGDYIASPCKECCALVIDTGFHDYTAKHVAWHNKMLP